MISRITNAYPNCGIHNCLETTTAPKIIIIDTISGRACIWNGQTKLCYPCFTVINSKLENVNFLAIDGCIYQSEDNHKRCDFAVFNDKTFCFVELKLAERSKNRSIRRKDALVQLDVTINKFKQLISFQGYTVEAFACVGYKSTIPKSRASNTNKVKEFWDTHNVDLCAGNQVVFS